MPSTSPRRARLAPAPPALRLPPPALRGGPTLTAVLKRRRTTRELTDRPLSPRRLSQLLWAACGVNRRDGPFGLPGLTTASASNSQEVQVFVLLARGAYRYRPLQHALEPVARGDLRQLAIGRRQVAAGARAAVRLVYVADLDRLANTQGYQEPGLQDPEVQRAYAFVDTGLIAAHVYLAAAALGLGAWFHNCDREALAGALRLQPHERVLFGQTVGHPLRRGSGRGARRARAGARG